MKTLVLFLAGAMCSWAAPVVERVLDPRAVIDLPVSAEVTTLTLPGPISAVVGSDVVLDAGRGIDVEPSAAPRFHVTHVPNAPFVHVRSLASQGSARLTLLFEERAYVFTLRVVASDSVASVILARPPASEPRVIVPLNPPARSAQMGQALLDRARAFPLLAQSMPRATLGMASHLENRTAAEVKIDPASFKARIGDQSFSQTAVRSPVCLQPGEKAAAEFAVIGRPDGSRDDLSLDNAFTIEVTTKRQDKS